MTFPDSWPYKVNLIYTIIILAENSLYLYPGYLVFSGQVEQEISSERIAGGMLLYIFGMVIVTGSDCHKYFALKYSTQQSNERTLIDSGFFATTRNPNYFGEVMVFSSLCFIVTDYKPWLVYGYIWLTHFRGNMLRKDGRLEKKAGFKEYKSRSNMFFFKFANSWIVTELIYINIVVFGIAVYLSGGMEEFMKNAHYLVKHELIPYVHRLQSVGN